MDIPGTVFFSYSLQHGHLWNVFSSGVLCRDIPKVLLEREKNSVPVLTSYKQRKYVIKQNKYRFSLFIDVVDFFFFSVPVSTTSITEI